MKKIQSMVMAVFAAVIIFRIAKYFDGVDAITLGLLSSTIWNAIKPED